MPTARRRFLKTSALGLAASLAPGRDAAAQEPSPGAPPGMPPAFGTGPVTGPEITPATIAEAEKLAQVQYTPAQRAQAAENWQRSLAPLAERRTGPRKVAIPDDVPPASVWDPTQRDIVGDRPVGPDR